MDSTLKALLDEIGVEVTEDKAEAIAKAFRQAQARKVALFKEKKEGVLSDSLEIASALHSGVVSQVESFEPLSGTYFDLRARFTDSSGWVVTLKGKATGTRDPFFLDATGEQTRVEPKNARPYTRKPDPEQE